MSTIKDVAQLAGVSVSLVSRVLNDKKGVSTENRTKIQSAILQLNYTPNPNARAMSRGKQHAIGVILPNLSTPYFSTFMSGIEQVATQHNEQLVLNSSAFDLNKELNALDTLVEQRYDSIILFSTSISDTQLAEYLDKVPGLILFDRVIPKYEHRCIWLDDKTAALQMVETLVEHNHQHIAIVDLPQSMLHSAKRRTFLLQSLKAHDISVTTSLIEHSDGSIAGGQEAAYNLLASKQNFSAIVCFNDATAYGAATFLTQQGYKIPQDISIIGFNDSIYSRLFVPNFHTIHTPVNLMGQRATELAITLSKTPNTYVDVKQNCFAPRLIENSSVSFAQN